MNQFLDCVAVGITVKLGSPLTRSARERRSQQAINVQNALHPLTYAAGAAVASGKDGDY